MSALANTFQFSHGMNFQSQNFLLHLPRQIEQGKNLKPCMDCLGTAWIQELCLCFQAGWGFIYKDDHEEMIMQDARGPTKKLGFFWYDIIIQFFTS